MSDSRQCSLCGHLSGLHETGCLQLAADELQAAKDRLCEAADRLELEFTRDQDYATDGGVENPVVLEFFVARTAYRQLKAAAASEATEGEVSHAG